MLIVVLLQQFQISNIARIHPTAIIMERPQSQLENMRPSGLKPPSRLPQTLAGAVRTLGETSQSDLNARSARDGHMPPPVSTTKHKPSNRE